MTDLDQATLRRLLDESEIRKTLAGLAQATDDGTPDDYATFWTTDAVWEVIGYETRNGRDGIRAGAQSRFEAGLIGPDAKTRHLVSTQVINVTGDRATARSAHTVVITKDSPVVAFCGVYEDELARVGDRWLIAYRRVIPQ